MDSEACSCSQVLIFPQRHFINTANLISSANVAPVFSCSRKASSSFTNCDSIFFCMSNEGQPRIAFIQMPGDLFRLTGSKELKSSVSFESIAFRNPKGYTEMNCGFSPCLQSKNCQLLSVDSFSKPLSQGDIRYQKILGTAPMAKQNHATSKTLPLYS